MNEKIRGKHIVIDGIDACGKSAIVSLLWSYIADVKGYKCKISSEPTDEKIGSAIRDMLKTSDPDDAYTQIMLTHLFIADRLENYDNYIRPLLDDGAWVISSRYKCSTVAYQSKCYSTEYLWELQEVIPDPDVYIILDVDPETALERMNVSARDKDGFEQDIEFQKFVRERYIKMAQNRYDMHLVDASRLIPNVFASVANIVDSVGKDEKK